MYSSINPSNGEPFYPLSLLEYRAANDPEFTWAKIPTIEDSYDAGFTSINYAQLQNAVDGAAEWLQTTTGRQPGETIAYWGPWDPRHVWMVLGACKAGYKMVFPTPLFAPEVLDRFAIQTLNCKAVITGMHETPTLVTDFATCNGLPYFQCPSLHYFLHEKHMHIPCKSYEAAADDVLAIMSTSGSTSDAKPIVWTNSFAASFYRQITMEAPVGWESLDKVHHGVHEINILPVLHCGSLYSHLLVAPLTKTIVHYPLPESPRHAETFLQLLEHVETHINTAVIPPAYAEYIATLDPPRLAKIAAKLSVLCYAGGAISTSVGEALSRCFKVFSLFACTENGVYPLLRPQGSWDPDRWRTVRFHPDAGVKFDSLGDGSYELVIERPENSSIHDPSLPPALKVFPDLDVWHTEDVFTPDPTELGSWLYTRRVSDNITYTDGSSFNPLPYEQSLRAHPAISAALLFGSRKPNGVLLLEPAVEYNSAETDRDALIGLIWPAIEEANGRTGGMCVVSRERIVVTKPGREIPRATKGTIQRGKARMLYQDELLRAL